MTAKKKSSISTTPVPAPKVTLANIGGYDVLVKAVRLELQELDFFVRRRTAESYWRVGRFIHEHLLKRKDRAAHGSGFFEALAKDVGRDSSTLQKMVRFYKTFPNLADRPDLSWSHYRLLMSVKDARLRLKLQQQIEAKNCDSEELEDYLRQKRQAQAMSDPSRAPAAQLKVVRGRLEIYKVLATEARGKGRPEVFIDYGFGVRRPFPQAKEKGFKDGDLVEYAQGQYIKTDTEDSLRYTYKAYVERVVDGDTLLVLIEGGGGNLVQERLRLRGIDCPEIATEEGKRAKRFVEEKLKAVSFIIIRTYKEQVDIHARYLADVFFLPDADEAAVAVSGHFLNQELLDERLAREYA